MTEETEEEKKPNWANFGIGLGIIFAFIIIIMLFGSLFLYTIKVGASNILPTDINIDKISEQIPKKVDANVLREFSFFGLNIFNPLKTTSQKLTFNNINTPFKNIALWLGPGFFGSLIDKMLSFNDLLLNSLSGFLNGWNESILILMSGFMYPFIVGIYFIFNWFFLFIDQFIEFAGLLSNTFWLHPILAYVIEVLICIPLIAIFSIIASVVSIFTVLYSLFIVPFGYATYNIQGDSRNNTFRRFFTDAFKYKTTFMTVLFLLMSFGNVQTSLGFTYAAIYAFVAFISIYVFGILQTTINLDDDSQTAGLIPSGITFNLMGGKKLRVI
jgi:hypothetical protein